MAEYLLIVVDPTSESDTFAEELRCCGWERCHRLPAWRKKTPDRDTSPEVLEAAAFVDMQFAAGKAQVAPLEALIMVGGRPPIEVVADANRTNFRAEPGEQDE